MGYESLSALANAAFLDSDLITKIIANLNFVHDTAVIGKQGSATSASGTQFRIVSGTHSVGQFKGSKTGTAGFGVTNASKTLPIVIPIFLHPKGPNVNIVVTKVTTTGFSFRVVTTSKSTITGGKVMWIALLVA